MKAAKGSLKGLLESLHLPVRLAAPLFWGALRTSLWTCGCVHEFGGPVCGCPQNESPTILGTV